MKRKEFIKLCGILGVGLPLDMSIKSCSDEDRKRNNFTGKVIVIGAGAGGLTAGYLLKQRGVDFEILEASSVYGGRMKRTTDFVDFPIPLGAEWLHTQTEIFKVIVNDDNVPIDINTVGYNENDTNGHWEDDELTVSELEDSDRKFVDSTWFDFYEEYIVPHITNEIVFDTIVESIDYSGGLVIVNTQNGEYRAHKVIVSVPLKILQDGDISFIPGLPSPKQEAIDEATIWDGFKAFIEFSDKFYHTATSFNINPASDGQKLYYDASYGQNTNRNVLGLFVVGKPAQDYISRSGEELKNFILAELDEIYSNQASANYIKHITQNWNDEPFIKAAYLSDYEDWRTVRNLAQPVDNKIYFAGGPYTLGEDWVSVNAAAASAINTVNRIV